MLADLLVVLSLRDGKIKERCFFLPSDNPSGIKRQFVLWQPSGLFLYSSRRDGSSVEKKYQSKIASWKDATGGWGRLLCDPESSSG